MHRRLDRSVSGNLYKSITIEGRRYALALLPVISYSPSDAFVVRGTITAELPNGSTRLFDLDQRPYAIAPRQIIELWDAANDDGTVQLCTVQDLLQPESALLLGLTGPAEPVAIAYGLQHQTRELRTADGRSELAGRCEIAVTTVALALAYALLAGHEAPRSSSRGEVRSSSLIYPNLLEIAPHVKTHGTLHAQGDSALTPAPFLTPAIAARRLVAGGSSPSLL